MEPAEYQRLYELEETLWWFRGMDAITTALIDRYLEPGSKDPATGELQILDAGCGTGGTLRRFSKIGRCCGVDYSVEALRFARQRQSAFLTRASIERLPFADGRFDLVTSFDVIYHLDVADDGRALSEMARVVADRGIVVMRVPAFDFLRSQHDVAVHTRQRYGRRELASKLNAAGLNPIHLSFANTFLFPLALAKRLAERILPGSSEESEVQPMSPGLNRLLTSVLSAEAYLVARFGLPFGLSLYAVAKKR